jgi:hypothetical protein
MSEFDELLAARRVELETERDAALAQLPAAREAYEKAFRALENAQFKWNSTVERVTRASTEARTLSYALEEVLSAERGKYHAAGAELRRTKDCLANLRWTVECRNHDLGQLQRLADPPKSGPTLEVVPRPQAPAPDIGDNIVMPPGSTPRAA